MSASPSSTSPSSKLGRGLPVRCAAARSRPRIGERLWPLGLYLALSIVLFGIPVIGHLGSHIVAVNDLDPSTLMWFLGWWPHALLHGLNPFVTHAMLYPDGYNITWSTSMPLPSLVLAPITLAFGPAVSWNVLQLLAPALSAWTAFLLCRHITGRSLPALVGGYIFGFSPYMLAHLQGSPTLAVIALLPVFVLLTLKRVEDSISPRCFVVAMTLALVAQFLISPEVLATSTLFGGIALVGGFALLKDHRRPLLQTVGLLVVAYAVTAVLVSPYLYYFLFAAHYPPGTTNFGAILLSFVVPPPSVALQPPSAGVLAGSNVENYLGVPLLLLIAIFVWRERRSRTALLPVLCLMIAAVLSLGGLGVTLRDHVTRIWMPWRLFSSVPGLHYAIPARFAVFVILPAAMIVAMWLHDAGTPSIPEARPRHLAQWGLALLAVAFIVPDFGNRVWNTPITDPPFFQHGGYRAYLTSHDHVLTIPTWGPSQRWIADAGFPFALSAGSGGQGFPAGYTRYPIWDAMLAPPYTLPADYPTELRRFLSAKDVTAIVVQQGFPGPWQSLFATLRVRPITTGGVILYRLRRPPSGG